LNEVIPLCTYYIMLYYIFPSTQLQVIEITATAPIHREPQKVRKKGNPRRAQPGLQKQRPQTAARTPQHTKIVN